MFTEGKAELFRAGIPQLCWFLLSTRATADLSPGDTLADGLGEITGTGYMRQAQAAPAAVDGAVLFERMSFSTGPATDWPSDVRSVILATTPDDSGAAICAWDLKAASDMSQVNMTQQVKPTLLT